MSDDTYSGTTSRSDRSSCGHVSACHCTDRCASGCANQSSFDRSASFMPIHCTACQRERQRRYDCKH
jgi:hypothetical protein